jgi:16S rRNA (adenine1518-N6/adenine1519-N6)-dimethyltransferase
MPRLALSSGSRGARLRERTPGHAAAPSARAGSGSGSAATSGVPAALRAIGVRPSRRLGQNFLIDPRVAERIAALVDDPREPVIEIGPGLGALTMLLAATGRELTAVELDLRLAEALEMRLAPWPAARVVRGDILEQRAEDLASGPATVVANLPYSITTPALEWIVAQGGRVRRAVLMVQREYAQRLSAKPGGKEHGSITVFLRLHAEVRVLFRVSPGAFHPRPEVDSVVLEVVPHPYAGTTTEERAAAERLARAGMGTRRKTLANALGRALQMDGASVRAWLEVVRVDPERRGETLTVDEWIALARHDPRSVWER